MAQQIEHFSASPTESTCPSSHAQYKRSTHSGSPSPTDATTPNGNKTLSSPTHGSGGSAGLNPRSCVTCRKRKVKCDKRQPCSNCSKAAIECVFPGPGRAPRRARKPPDTELLARLRRLEGVVQSLGKGVDEDGETVVESTEVKQEQPQSTLPEGVENATSRSKCSGPTLHESKQDTKDTRSMAKEFGRLVVEDGRSRYVSNKFWISLSEEVAEMRDILDDPTEDEDEDHYPSPGSGSSASANHQGFLFNFSSTVLDLRRFHPPQEQIPIYWKIFKSNVDPVIKLLHVPHHEHLFYEASQDLDHVSKPMELFMFTIYFSAVTTISPDDCLGHFRLEKSEVLAKYRFAVEQALARAGFLSTNELLVLQSMLLFLTCVRRSDDTRYVWTLTGILIRLAQALGVHRDGQKFGISPFETEMRRRLWWQIATLDVRASEDHGSDPSIIEQNFDTKFPLNINDEDISPTTKEPPQEHEGATELTFDLIRYTVSTTVRRLSYAPPGTGPCATRAAGLTLEDKERMIEDMHQYLERKYLRYCDTTIPLHWVSATVARLIMAKMWLVVHHPFSRVDRGLGLSPETKDRLFKTSVEVIEFSRLLETDASTLRWGWLFRTYIQWHALAYVLSQLCVRTLGPEVDKAWIVIEGVFEDWGGTVSSNQRGMLWKPLRKLMSKARSARTKALQKQARFPLDGSIGPTTSASGGLPRGSMSSGNGNNGFSALNSSMSVPNDNYSAMMTPESIVPKGQQQQPQPQQQQQQSFLPMDQTQTGAIDEMEPMAFDPAFYPQDQQSVDETMNWEGWDSMVNDYQMEGMDGGQGGQRRPALDGIINWW